MKEICLLHANCQGDPLEFLLMATPAFAGRFDVVRITNYTREPIPDALMDRCALFLFQPLGAQWDELASSRLLDKLRPEAQHLQLPNMFFKGYWPFWTNDGPLNFGDALLDHLADQGLTLEEAMRFYLRGHVEAFADLERVVTETLDKEREKERLAVTDIAGFVAAHWRERQLYTSVNHPVQELLIRVADAVLAALGMPPVADAASRACPPCDADFDLPIHPAVGRHFGLPFVSEDRTYNIFGRPMTFTQYAACYMDCRLRGLDNFISYLHLVPN